MTRDPSASLSLAVFFGQSRDWPHALTHEVQAQAETLTDDPLRGDPESPTIRHLIALLHRPRALVAAFFTGADRGRAEGGAR